MHGLGCRVEAHTVNAKLTNALGVLACWACFPFAGKCGGGFLILLFLRSWFL